MLKQEIYQEIGLRLAKLRNERNLSQVDIAKKFHIGQTTYSSYENGTRKIPLDLFIIIIIALTTMYQLAIAA